MVTLEEALALQEEAGHHDGLMSAEDYFEFSTTDYKAELEAENAWLRAAENAGWEEAYLESLVESGLISRY